MQDAQATLDRYYLEMRWRCLSLAADFDRIERSSGGTAVLASDPRIQRLRDAMKLLESAGANRAEKLQMIFSDKTPAPR